MFYHTIIVLKKKKRRFSKMGIMKIKNMGSELKPIEEICCEEIHMYILKQVIFYTSTNVVTW